jgi:hypothetical protein
VTVGGLGVSSGGHLILLAAMRPHDPRYTALPFAAAAGVDGTLAYAISLWGVLDPYGRYLMAQERGNKELMASHERYFLTVDAMQESNLIRILQQGDARVRATPDERVRGRPQGRNRARRTWQSEQEGMFGDSPSRATGSVRPTRHERDARKATKVARRWSPEANERTAFDSNERATQRAHRRMCAERGEQRRERLQHRGGNLAGGNQRSVVPN